MKLSEAILLGSLTKPQARGGLYETKDRPVCTNGVLGLVIKERVASCALGAAFEAANCGSHTEAHTDSQSFRGSNAVAGEVVEIIETPAEWGSVLYFQAQCPECGKSNITQRLIAHLNDGHEWQRERIAYWVSRIESEVERLKIPFQPLEIEQEEREDIMRVAANVSKV